MRNKDKQRNTFPALFCRLNVCTSGCFTCPEQCRGNQGMVVVSTERFLSTTWPSQAFPLLCLGASPPLTLVFPVWYPSLCSILPFLKSFSPRRRHLGCGACPCPCSGAIGAGWGQHQAGPASPHAAALQHPSASAWAPAPSLCYIRIGRGDISCSEPSFLSGNP